MEVKIEIKNLKLLQDFCKKFEIEVHLENHELIFTSSKNKVKKISIELFNNSVEKVIFHLQSQFNLNQKVFARKCEIKRVEKQKAEDFLKQYHFMDATKAAYHFGLYYNDELIALTTFSKGRKMNRLPEHLRSFELIRFCCKGGITVTGGLSKLINYFCDLKNAGDVMTYIDKQLSEGKSFITAGFEKDEDFEDVRNLKLIFKPFL